MNDSDKFLISAKDQATLKFLLDEVDHSFRDSKDERKRLHEIEWAAGEEAASILGEAEIRMDFVIGVVQTWLEYGYEKDRRDDLMRYSIHCSSILHDWLKEHSADYPRFAVFLQVVELLRVVALRVLCAS